MKTKVFLTNLLILSIFFGFAQKARGDTIPTVFNAAITQTGATAPLVREGSFDVEIIFAVDATNDLDLSVVPTVTFTPQVGGPFDITPLDPTNPLNFGPHPTPPADPDHNYYIFRGTGHALSTMGTGWANMTISGAQSDSGTMTFHTETNAFYIDYTAPAVTPNCLTGITVTPAVTGVGTVIIGVAFAEDYLLDYTVSPTVVFYPSGSSVSVAVIQNSYSGNQWTGTAIIDAAVADGNATIEVTGAQDLAGNVMLTCDQVTFIVDNTPPESSAQPLPACSNGVPILVSYQAQDVGFDSSGVASVQLWYRLDGGSWVNSGLSPSGGAFGFNATGSLPDGAYEFATQATDNVGNQEVAPTIATVADATTILDRSAPTVTSVTTTPNPAGEGNVTITVTFNDDDCGMENNTAPTVTYTIGATTVPVVQTSYIGNTWIGQAPAVGDAQDCEATVNISGAADCCGNVMSANSDYGFSIDTVAPVITTVQIIPQGGANGDCSAVGEVTFIVTLTEVCGLDYAAPVVVQFTPANSTTPVPVTQYSYSNNVWTGKAMVEATTENGDATVDITGATDKAGNIAQANNSYSFCIDTTPPQSWVEALSPYSTGNTIKATYRASDPGVGNSGVDSVSLWYRANGGSWINSGLTPTNGEFIFTPPAGVYGLYEFATVATDAANNQESLPAAPDASTVLDQTSPMVTSVNVQPDPANEGLVIVTITFADNDGLNYNISPVVQFLPNGSTTRMTVEKVSYANNTWTGQATILNSYPNGPAKIYISGATDNAGNQMAEVQPANFIIDTTPPAIANCSTGATGDITVTPDPAPAGGILFEIEFTESNGLNYSIAPTVIFYPKDSANPVAATQASYTNNLWTGIAVIDSTVPNGEATIVTAGATDLAGNVMPACNTAKFIIDTTPPESWVEAPSTYSNQSAVTVNYQSNDPGVGSSGVDIVRLWYRLNGGSWINSGATDNGGNFTFIPGIDGTYGFATRATDMAGNQEALPATADASITIDRNLPIVISATVSPNPAGEGTVVVTLTFSDADGIDHDTSPLVEFLPNGSANRVTVGQTSWANNTWTGQTTILNSYPNGPAKIYVSRVTDNAGNRMAEAQPVSFVIDITPPAIEVCSTTAANHDITATPDPAPAGEILFEIAITENYQLNYNISPTVVFYPKDQTTPVAVTKSSYGNNLWTGIALIPVGTPNGEATIVVAGATDLAGNVMPACNTAKFIIDTTPPGSQVAALPQYTTGNSIQITYSADDPGVSPSGVNEVELWYRVNGGSWINSGQTDTTGNPTGSFAFNFLDGVDGLYEFATMATDNAANQEALSATADASTTVSRQGPSVILATADPDQAGEGYVTITVTFDDGGNGLDYNIIPAVTYVIGTTTVNAAQISYANNTWTGQALVGGGMNGEATIRVRNFKDLAGNLVSSDVSAGTFVIDTTPPATNCSTIPPNPGIIVTYAPAPVGEVTFEIRFTECCLNYDVSPTVIFYPKDSIVPIQVTEVSYIDNRWTGTALIPAGTPNGQATIVITGAADLAGNVMPACNAAKFIIDTAAPVSQVTAAYKYSPSSLRIDYTAQDLPTQEASGLKQVDLYYRVDAGDGFSEWAWTGLPPKTTVTGYFIFELINGDGVYEFYTLAIDGVNNVESAPDLADISYNYDSQGPRVKDARVTPDPAGAGAVTFEIEFGSEANGLDYDVSPQVEFSPYGSNTYCKVNQVSWAGNVWVGEANILNSYSSGQARIKISGARDTLSNEMSPNSAYSFIIDNSPPQVLKVDIIPQDGGSCSRVGEVTFIIAFSENYLLNYNISPEVSFYPARTVVPVMVTQYSYDNNVWTGKAVVTPDMENGEATVNITGAADLAGNMIIARNTDHFCIDVVPPESAAIAAYKGNSIHIDYTAQDLPTEEASGLKRVDLYYRVDMGDGFSEWAWTGLDPKTASAGTFVFSPKDDGTYEFYTIATDKAHNVEEAPDLADVSFIYDSGKPMVKSVRVAPDPAGEGVVVFEVEFAHEINGLNYDISPLVEFSPLAEATSMFGGSSPTIKVKVDQISWEDNIWTGRATILQSYNSGEATIKITNARDMAGNVMDPDSSYSFMIDTDPPVVSLVSVNPNPAKAGEVLITIDFKEEHSVLDMRVDPEVYVLTHNPNGGVKLIVEKTSYNNNRFTGKAWIPDQFGIDGPADIWVSGAIDAVGNEMPATNANTFMIDVTDPSSLAFSKKYTGYNQIAIDFQASDPGVYATGPKHIELYWRYSQNNGESWTDWAPYGVYTGEPSSYGLTGTIIYPALREGVYEFYTIATDKAGNVELPPAVADTRIVYDKSIIDPPEVKSVTVDPDPAKNGYAYITIEFKENEAPLDYNVFPSVTVTPYGGEPLKVEMISYKENSKTWKGRLLINNHNSGIATINISGAQDIVGNIMQPDSTHIFFIDTLIPISSVTHVPPYTKDSLIKVDFQSQDPEPSSGLRNTYLWYRYKKEGTDLFSSWMCYKPGFVNSNGQGTFDFYPDQPNVSAKYEFYTAAEDKAYNLENKTGQAEASTIYDVGMPEVLEVSLNSVNIEPYNASYAAKAGKLTVRVKFKEEFSGLNYGKNPVVTFRPSGGISLTLKQISYNNNVWVGEYDIPSNIPNGEAVLTISKAEDMSGNVMADDSSYKFIIDTDDGDVASIASSPGYARSSPFDVEIEAWDSTTGSGAESATLYYRLDQGQPSGFGEWIEYTTKNNAYSDNPFKTVVKFLPPYDGTYEFYTIARDTAGNTEGIKYQASTVTIYDSVKPGSVITSIPSSYTIELSEFKIYFDAFDQVPSSGIDDVILWYRVDAENGFEVWRNASLEPVMNQGRDHGYFNFAPPEQGEYEFYVQAIDNAGNVEEGEEAEASIIVGLKEVEKEICHFGGKVKSGPNGPLTLEFPEGALNDCTIIKIKPIAGEAITDINSIGPVFDLQPSGKMFNNPVTLTIEYKESQLGVDVDENDLAIFYDDGFDWIPLPSTVDPINRTVSTSLLHFSRYTLAILDYQMRPSSLLDNLILTHNPIKAKGPGLVATEFEFMTTTPTGQATLRIFDALGEEIKKIHKSLSRTTAADPTVIPWDGTDEDGHLVDNGIYIFSLEIDSGRESKVETGVVGVVK